MLKRTEEAEDFLYLQIASRIENLIENDVYKIGDRLPSVRTMSKEQGISVSTAFQAYYHLENKGLIEPRPKSGYFVKISQKQFPKVPLRSKPKAVAKEVTVAETVANLYHFAASNPEAIKFSVGSPDTSFLPEAKLNKAVIQAMRNLHHSGLQYEGLLGNPQLRTEIAKRSIEWGGSYHPDEIITTNGCMAALIVALRAVTKPGDTVAIESPTYFGVLQAIESMGLKALELCTCPETGIELDKLEASIKKCNVKACLFISNFNNPMGSCIPDETKKDLVELLARYEIPLIEDDIYGELYFGSARPMNCKAFDKKGLVLLCSSFSKTLAPGYRVGWIIPGVFKDKILAFKHMSAVGTSTITQGAIAEFLENGRYDNHLKKLRSNLHGQVLKYTQAITEYFPEDIKITRPRGGFVLWLELPEQVDTFQLLYKAMDKNITFTPGKIFTAQNKYDNCMRISCGMPLNPKYEHGLETLGSMIKDML